MKPYRHFIFFLLAMSSFFSINAQSKMKSCCEEPGEKLVSTVKQAPGTLRMIRILDSITGSIDPEELYAMNTLRAERAKKLLESEKDLNKRFLLYYKYAVESLNAGNPDEAIGVLTQIMQGTGMTTATMTEQNKLFFDQLAISFMRKGEQENCAANHNAESCLMPIKGGGVHKFPKGSEEAIALYTTILNKFPNDLQSRYLLNLAYMTLDRYPADVPKQWLIEQNVFNRVNTNIVLKDVAGKLGVDMNGMAGGCVVDDLDNDGDLDIMASSSGANDQIRYMVQQTDKSFKIETASSGLVGITGGLNLIHADYNNDGFADIMVLRGGWWGKAGRYPVSLLKNNGNNTFQDVTIECGLYTVGPTQTATWADFNNDGWLDVFIAKENLPSELFMNNKGKFVDVAPKVGLNVNVFAKSTVSGDINNDGYPEIFISVIGGPNRLWLNKPGAKPGDRSFEEISKTAGIEEPLFSFPSWFFDYNNDGYNDIFVSGYGTTSSKAAEDEAKEMLGIPTETALPRLYRNNGNNTFTDISKELGVYHVSYTMGCNYGDLDNDGWLDYYLSTGNPLFQSIVPNKLYHNLGGKKFEDITYATNTGHIQKGHGVAFADIDSDGDQDIYHVVGGAYEGDNFRNMLYENSTVTSNHWIKIKLKGVTANRSAIGARVRIKVKMQDGSSQNFFHTVSTGGSFGSKPLMIEAGLGNAAAIEEVEVIWPNAKHTKEIYSGLAMDTRIVIEEGMGKQ